MILGLSLIALLAPQAKVDTSSYQSRFAVVNGVKLHYLDWGGSGEVLLFLAGTGDNAYAFDKLAPRFTDRYRVLALTRRGFGKSDKPASGYDIPSLTEDVRGFLDLKGIRRVNIVCHSAGGDETTCFATKYPNWVGKLIYLEAAYDRREIAAIEDSDPMGAEAPSSREQELHWRGMDAFRPEFKRLRAPVLSFYSLIGGHWGVNEKTPPALRKKAEQFMAERMRPYQTRNIERFRKDVPHAEVEVLRGTDHYFFEDPKISEWVVSRMRKFLLGG